MSPIAAASHFHTKGGLPKPSDEGSEPTSTLALASLQFESGFISCSTRKQVNSPTTSESNNTSWSKPHSIVALLFLVNSLAKDERLGHKLPLVLREFVAASSCSLCSASCFCSGIRFRRARICRKCKWPLIWTASNAIWMKQVRVAQVGTDEPFCGKRTRKQAAVPKIGFSGPRSASLWIFHVNLDPVESFSTRNADHMITFDDLYLVQ